ncbi:MAG: biotin/lipoyl-binding protein [Defluviitaleaceae bacterium]|nr:biotin/lipoyl-binding protein [Defluviitaleaceae bacterium]
MKKFFCLIGVICAAGILAGCSNDVEPRQAVFAEIQTGGEAQNLTARGVVESVERRSVYSTLGFIVERVYVEAGDEVEAGQLLAVLDTGDLELMISQQRVEIEMLRNMVEIIPPQRRAELANMRRMAALAPAQQQAELRAFRETGENAVQLSRRMFEEAYANLANNANMHVVGAESALTATELNLTTVRRNYEIARADYAARSNPHVTGAESALTAARLQLETLQSDRERFERLYEAGGLSRNELRQIEIALEHAQNSYGDAVTGLETAEEAERRALEQLGIALAAAESAHTDATVLLETTRLAAEQELEMLRSNLSTAEISANLEPLEIAVDMASLEIRSGVEAMEHAVNLEIAQLNAQFEAAEISLQLMERQLENAQITAPISGTVTAVIAREGAIGAGPMFVVEDTENLRVMTRFREYDIAFIRPGMEALITADATGTHVGEVRRVNPAAAFDSHIVEFEVEVAIPENTGLLIGMNARIEIDFLHD